MWIKICGNTNVEDALLAADLGADAVGFVFAPSPRQVTPPQAATIVAQLPASLEKVGVFPAWPSHRIVQAVEEANLTAIQLHAAPDAACTDSLSAHFSGRVAIIQVVHWHLGLRLEQATEIESQIDRLQKRREQDRILIDSKIGTANGGTGTAFPWDAAKPIFAANRKLILAGGLTQHNVADAIDRLVPSGVDAVSGVEASPGKKDREKLAAFIQAVRGASVD